MDTSPITARSLQKPYHVKGDEFERAYKDHLSDFRTWKHREHAQRWLVFPKNIGPNLSIDETALSNGDLYTIVSNKDAHGRKGALLDLPNTKMVQVYYHLRLITVDPDDDKFVDCAFKANAKYIVTQDHHYDVLKQIPFPHIEVVDIDEFLNILH